MGFDAFLKIGDIEGESADRDHAGWIEVLDFDFGIAQDLSKTASSAGGAASGRADFTELGIAKLLDKASPGLALACAEGRHIDTVILEICRAGKVKYMSYKLTDCLISSATVNTVAEFPEEYLAIDYGRIEMSYIKQDRRDGQASGSVTTGWDRTRNCGI